MDSLQLEALRNEALCIVTGIIGWFTFNQLKGEVRVERESSQGEDVDRVEWRRRLNAVRRC